MKKKFLVISGPNLRGTKDVPMKEEGSLEDVHSELRKRAAEIDVQVDCFQLSAEGEIVDCLRKAAGNCAGAIIDSGASAVSGDELRSAIGAASFPCVEVTVSTARKGEEHRHESPIASACVGAIGGFGPKSYLLALEALFELTKG